MLVLRLGWTLGFNDFKIVGIGTRLGRSWPTIGLAIRVLVVGLVFGLVYRIPVSDLIPWLASGWLVWSMMQASLVTSAEVFNANKGLMLAIAMPKEALVARVVAKETLQLIQNSLVVFLTIVFFGKDINFVLLLAIPGILLSAIFLFSCGLILGPLVAKYKDFGPFISSIVGVMFFVLPIMWKPESIESELAHLILGLNPLYHYLQIVRLPFLSEVPTDINYLLATAGAVVFLVIGILVMKRSRNKIVYWA